MVVTIYIPTRPGHYGRGRQWQSVLSPNARVPWQMRHRVLRQDKEFGRAYWLQAVNSGKAWSTPASLVSIEATLHVLTPNQRRDMDNLVPTLKGIIDGLVLGGCVRDDSIQQVRLSVKVSPVKATEYGVTLRITKEA